MDYDLTDEELDSILKNWFKGPNLPESRERAIATAAIQKYQEWLAKQCGALYL